MFGLYKSASLSVIPLLQIFSVLSYNTYLLQNMVTPFILNNIH
jgi:hypothetical protein